MGETSPERKVGSGRPKLVTEESKVLILDAVENDRSLSVRAIAQDEDLNPQGLCRRTIG
jgi:hypothetical protein